ncbi:exosporium leader peptide [Bacillus cereus]|uniref:Exosporium leader peptide-containing protein n=1 Tax=Bacillus nitratireducens TaxID=2026193 RepID=A0ABU6PK31_9BACI|nr:exosporium leader peptide-containing protein [Bacillus nitratireducens]EJS56234.1 exosporium leader peptide [Bacillus cereus BAG1X1-3]EOO76667.1 exosporium leader peptide [Bacillus cereus BAG1O-1]EOP53865.1 exosporium leader peptide [Bacillus cereus VDM053]PDY08267.1 exosporium leader peptide [Bacillus cereus]MDR4173822.1 exosporium leader peptide-containing protein [Bacillus nitratireducens]
MDEFLSSTALNPDSIGPTLPPMQPFQFPTGTTGPTLFFTSLAPDPEPNENNLTLGYINYLLTKMSFGRFIQIYI